MRNASMEIRRHTSLAMLFTVVLGGSAAAWSLLVPLGSAVVTSGSIVVESSIKKVQHPTGGVVGSIFVKEGQHVEQGEVVVRLDDTIARANLSIVLNDLNAGRVRLARLAAERDQSSAIEFPADLQERASREPPVERLLASEQQIFQSRWLTREGQRAQLTERVGQLTNEIAGLGKQLIASQSLLSISTGDLLDLEDLKVKRLVQRSRLAQLEREIAQSSGQVGDISAKIASARGKSTEVGLQILQLDKDLQTEVAKDLRETATKIGELEERKIAGQDQLQRIEIRAPISGVVHQLTAHTVGGVISQTEPLMMIVPDADRLIVEVRIAPSDRDQVHMGQTARLRFTAFNARLTPEVDGTLIRIASDLTRETNTNASYYLAGITIDEAELKKTANLKFVPGMPVEAFIATGARTFASYMLKPLSDQMERAFRER